jgi:4-amino-4-deoxy-L-arabinose transferase-like glycosyltransferase
VELFHVDDSRVAREVRLASLSEEQRTSRAIILTLVLIVVRGVFAASTPLTFDEAYYWMWSKHLAGGYYDHPPAIAVIVRAGTAMFGDTSLGVRFVTFLLSIASSWAVWRSGAILLESEYLGALAVLSFNAMPMIGIEALAATPDAPELTAAAFFLCALAKVAETERGAWWIAAGVAAGVALLSKYTAFFLGAGALLWLVVVPRERRWLLSFWPYLGGVIALAMFAPVIQWNAEHGWISFAAQFGRIGAGGFTLRYLGEFLAAQLGLASPFLAILGVAGMVTVMRGGEISHGNRALLVALMTPAIVYFVLHSLHDRVQGNWPSFLYPMFAILAAIPVAKAARTWGQWSLRWSRTLGVPVAAFMSLVIYGQGAFGFIPIVRDPVSRLLAVGIDRFTMDIDLLRKQEDAGTVLTTSYATTSWLAFYLPSHAPVVQLNERFRWLNEPAPAPKLFNAPMLYVTETRNDQIAELKLRFAAVEMLAHIARYRSGAELEEYTVYRVEGLRGTPYF